MWNSATGKPRRTASPSLRDAGSRSVPARGVRLLQRPITDEPVRAACRSEGAVAFAGDHTSHRPGFMHGAVAAALRVVRDSRLKTQQNPRCGGREADIRLAHDQARRYLSEATVNESLEFGEACPLPPAAGEDGWKTLKGKRVGVIFGLPRRVSHRPAQAKHMPGLRRDNCPKRSRRRASTKSRVRLR